IDGAEARAEVVLLERPNRMATRILELLCLQVEDGSLAVDLCGWEIQRVPKSRIERQALGHFPVVLNEVLLDAGALLNIRLLKVAVEALDLSEREAGKRVAGFCDAGETAADRGEGERSRRPWRLHDVQSFPPPVETHLQRVAAFQPRQRIRDFG